MSYFLRAHSVIIHGHRGNRRHVYGLFCASVHTFPPNRFSTKSINSPESQLERIRGEDNLCVCAWSESGRKCRHRYFIVVVLSSRRNRDLIDTTTRIGEKYEQTTIIFHRERAARKTGSWRQLVCTRLTEKVKVATVNHIYYILFFSLPPSLPFYGAYRV